MTFATVVRWFIVTVNVTLAAVVATAIAALTTFRTWTTLALRTLNIIGWLLNQHTVRELELAGLLVDVNQLHVYRVAFLDAGFLNGLQALPVNLTDVEQTVLAWHELNEATVRHH
jgi:hypothetical protein